LSVAKGQGPGGTTEVGGGLIIHIASKTTTGSPTAPSALPYTVTESALLPDLSGLPELPEGTEVPPIPGAPELPSQATLTALLPHGKFTQVKGKELSATHITGALNLDTGPGAPSPWPVWVPLRTTGSVTDTGIDFAGYPASITNAAGCFTVSGKQTCVGIGVLIGTGAAMFKPGLLALPTIP
jgi:hypothetical protein